MVDLNYPSEQAQIDRIQRVLGKFVASHVKCTEYCNKRYNCTLLYSDMTEAYPTKEKNAVFILFVNSKKDDLQDKSMNWSSPLFNRSSCWQPKDEKAALQSVCWHENKL